MIHRGVIRKGTRGGGGGVEGAGREYFRGNEENLIISGALLF